MDDADATRFERLHENAPADGAPADGAPMGALTAAAFVAPWILLAFALPVEWRWKAIVLVALLGLLLALAALVTERVARARGLDPAWWGFVAVVTFGVGMLVAYAWTPGLVPGHPQAFCHECGRVGDAREPFCFGCGANG